MADLSDICQRPWMNAGGTTGLTMINRLLATNKEFAKLGQQTDIACRKTEI